MAKTEKKTETADTKPVETQEQAAARFTKERLQADLQNLQGQAQQAEQMLRRAQAAVTEWQGKLQAIVGAHSYCTELLQAYGVDAKPLPETKPVETKTRKKREAKSLANGADKTASQPAAEPVS